MQPTKELLLCRLSALGDVVQTLAMVAPLRAEHPHARLTFLTQVEFAPLVERCAGVDQVLSFDRRGGARAILDLRRRGRVLWGARGPDRSVDPQGNWKSAALALLLGARQRLGYHPRDWRERAAALLATEWAPPAPGRAHAVERALGLLGAARRTPQPAPLWRLDPEERRRGAERAEELGPLDWVVHLGRPLDPRSWPAAQVERFARTASEHGAKVWIVSGPREAAAGRALADALGSSARVRHWIEQRGLVELLAFLLAAAERGTRFLGSDSGPVHLAQAAGMACVVVAGPQDPGLTGPYPIAGEHRPGAPSRAFGSAAPPPSPFPLHRALWAEAPPPCAPCLRRVCNHPRGPVCLGELDGQRAYLRLRGRAPTPLD